MQATLFHPSCHTHRMYGMRCDEYELLRLRGKYLCELCGRSKDRLVIDHDHDVDEYAVRGVICDKCNAHMRRIDSGERPIDERTGAYIVNPWYLAREGRRLDYEPAVNVQPHKLSKHDMAQLVRIRNEHWCSHSSLLRHPPDFEHPGVAECVAHNDFRPVLRLMWLTRLHPLAVRTRSGWFYGPRGRLCQRWP